MSDSFFFVDEFDKEEQTVKFRNESIVYDSSCQKFFNSKENLMPAITDTLRELRPYIIISNIIFTLGPLLSQLLLSTFTYENALYCGESNPVSYVSFDGLQFLTNYYTWEQNFAFLPGFVVVIRSIETVLRLFTSGKIANTLLVIIIVIFNKILTAVSAAYLFRIANLITKSRRLAKASSLVFLFNPASIFYHSVYSEPLYCCLSFAAISNIIETEPSWKHHLNNPIKFFAINWLNLCMLSAAVSIRSTALFLSLVLGAPILSTFWDNLNKGRILNVIKVGITGAVTLLSFCVVFVVYLYYGYREFCISEPKSWFCEDLLPNIYSAVQQKFWYVGFMKYYSAERAVMILFGVPSMLCGLLTAPNRLWRQQFGLAAGYWILLYITVFYSNVQSSARFFSSHPLYSINLALFLASKEGSPTILRKLTLLYIVVYNIAGMILFPIRFPWT